MFANRLRKRYKHLRKWAKRKKIDCYRIYNIDIPEFPFTVDLYQDHVHTTYYWRNFMHDIPDFYAWLRACESAIMDVFGISKDYLFLKDRKKQKGNTQYTRFNRQKVEIIVNEGGLKFWVNLSDFLDTGLFLDHRITRNMVRANAHNKDILNLFAYTGSFSVYAADGGAASTTTVDMSRTYLQWAERNMWLNNFSAQTNFFVQANVLEFIEDKDLYQSYDIIVLDPPTFSNSKRMLRSFDVQNQHVHLVNQCLKLLRPNGVLYFSNNYKRFKLNREGIQALKIEDITTATIPEDFKSKKSHYCFKLYK